MENKMRLLFVDIIIFMGGLIAGGAIMCIAASSGKSSMCETCLYKEFHKRYYGEKKEKEC